jgi:hypothetical protein
MDYPLRGAPADETSDFRLNTPIRTSRRVPAEELGGFRHPRDGGFPASPDAA